MPGSRNIILATLNNQGTRFNSAGPSPNTINIIKSQRNSVGPTTGEGLRLPARGNLQRAGTDGDLDSNKSNNLTNSPKGSPNLRRVDKKLENPELQFIKQSSDSTVLSRSSDLNANLGAVVNQIERKNFSQRTSSASSFEDSSIRLINNNLNNNDNSNDNDEKDKKSKKKDKKKEKKEKEKENEEITRKHRKTITGLLYYYFNSYFLNYLFFPMNFYLNLFKIIK